MKHLFFSFAFLSTLLSAEDAASHTGNIVIADQFNNRVIEVDPSTHQIVSSFGDGSFTPGPHSIVGPNDAERVGPFTLISGTGIPPMTMPCPTAAGCPDNRVIIVDQGGHIVWQYGRNAETGAYPVAASTSSTRRSARFCCRTFTS